MSGKAIGRIWEMELPHAEAWVLMALADHADHEGRNIYPGMGLVAWKTGYSRRQVQRVVNSLVTKGILVLEAKDVGRYGTNRYHIDWAACPYKPAYLSERSDKMSLPASDKMSLPASDKMSLGQNVTSDKMAPSVVTKCPPGSDIAMSPKPSIEPSIEPSLLLGATDKPSPQESRRTRIPPDFHVTPSMLAWAEDRGFTDLIDLEHETEEFVTHWRGDGTTKANWEPTWQNDMIKKAGWARNRARQQGAYKNGYQQKPNSTGRGAAIERINAELTREALSLVEEADSQLRIGNGQNTPRR
jgi:hypothetical protein